MEDSLRSIIWAKHRNSFITSNHISLASLSHMGPPICKGNISWVFSLEKTFMNTTFMLDQSSHIFTLFLPFVMWLCICKTPDISQECEQYIFPKLSDLAFAHVICLVQRDASRSDQNGSLQCGDFWLPLVSSLTLKRSWRKKEWDMWNRPNPEQIWAWDQNQPTHRATQSIQP